MNEAKTGPRGTPSMDVDAYLTSVPGPARAMLQEMRGIIHAAAPDAVESISYGVIGFKLHGRPLVYIGPARKHCALHAVSTSLMETYRDELAGYSLSKGGVRFPLGRPLPTALVDKLVRARVAENEGGKAK